MKLNKLALVLGLGLSVAAGSTFAADPVKDQGHGTVKFVGSIIDAPCSITPDTENQTVPLGQVATSALKDGGRSNSRDFKISLTNCTTETYKSVQTTFTGSEATDILAGSLGIEGIAKNAAVVITDAGGQQIKLGTPSAAQTLRDGNNDLNFAAYLQGSTAEAAVPGDFTAIATFALTYQ
ncbi:MAG TPA: fimbria A protein [Proteus sp.]|uniref:PapA family protein n=1 Tax=Proteus hauseri ATCC 700826 TaxID=1354271 RepID=A0AAJ3LU99_PROHU|nr:fimbrial protein [Proteus hauseri]OAT48229.1 PapA family protein [Proteus hauseri ATCC 700826]HCH49133.1 fimbria A protein [Proteus sp. (in: enterobacteria)]